MAKPPHPFPEDVDDFFFLQLDDFFQFGIGFDEFMLLDLPSTPNGGDIIVNSDKYLLYNDCFMGLFDNVVTENDSAGFREAAIALGKVKKNEFSYLFETAAAPCRLLEKKVDLGLKTRNAYRQKDRSEIKNLIPRYSEVISLAEEFYDLYEKQWMLENKPHGFDVQDIRIGGLIWRIKHLKKQLIRYIDGEIDRLEELEEEPLDIKGRSNNAHLEFNSWSGSVTSNIL